jgi:hypothetical protein
MEKEEALSSHSNGLTTSSFSIHIDCSIESNAALFKTNFHILASLTPSMGKLRLSLFNAVQT